jgi:hypothetical protein
VSDDPRSNVPDGVRKIIEAMVHQAVARCDRQGIALEDFLRMMEEEQKLRPASTLTELFDRIFRRLQGTTN